MDYVLTKTRTVLEFVFVSQKLILLPSSSEYLVSQNCFQTYIIFLHSPYSFHRPTALYHNNNVDYDYEVL